MYFKFILTSFIFVLAIDWYYFRSIKKLTEPLEKFWRRAIIISYWAFTLLVLLTLAYTSSFFIDKTAIPKF